MTSRYVAICKHADKAGCSRGDLHRSFAQAKTRQLVQQMFRMHSAWTEARASHDAVHLPCLLPLGCCGAHVCVPVQVVVTLITWLGVLVEQPEVCEDVATFIERKKAGRAVRNS